MTRPCPDLDLDHEWDLEWDLELDNKLTDSQFSIIGPTAAWAGRARKQK